MISIKKVKWNSIEEIAHTLYDGNSYLTPYQSFEFLDTVGLGRTETAPQNNLGYKEATLLVSKDDTPVMIAPLYVSPLRKIILLRGQYTIAAHLDFMYSPRVSAEDYKELFSYLSSHYHGYTFKFDRISEKSLTYSCLSELGLMRNDESSVCVSIHFGNGYQAWFDSLSKSYRQDIRSGYNRLKTDQKEYEFIFDIHNAPDSSGQKEIMRLYSKRTCEHSHINSGLVRKLLYLVKMKNPFNTALVNCDNYIGERLYIYGELVAYCQGFVSNDGRAIIPKLSIDLNYKRYNLGGLLINEMIKSISVSSLSDSVNQLDLSRGDEKYKYDYGGTEHMNYNWQLTL